MEAISLIKKVQRRMPGAEENVSYDGVPPQPSSVKLHADL